MTYVIMIQHDMQTACKAAFPRDWFQFELMLKNCAGNIYLAGVQESNRRAKEACQSLFVEFRSLSIHTQLELFHPFPRVPFLLGSKSQVDPSRTVPSSPVELQEAERV